MLLEILRGLNRIDTPRCVRLPLGVKVQVGGMSLAPIAEDQWAPALQDEPSVLHPRNHLPQHTLEESLLIGQEGTIVGSHRSYVSLRRPSS